MEYSKYVYRHLILIWLILLFTTIFHGGICKISIASEKPELILQTGPGSPTTFSSDGKFFLSGNKLFSIETGREIRRYKGEAFALSNDGKHVMSLSDNHLSFLDITSGIEQKGVTFKKAITRPFIVSLDGKSLISADDEYPNKNLVVWDLSTGNQVRVLVGHTGRLHCLSFSPNGRYLLSGSADMTLRLWDLMSGSSIRTFEGHYSDVTCAAFSLDGKYIISGGGDQVLELWEAATGKEIRVFEGHTTAVSSVAFSKDGKYIWSTGSDANDGVKLWERSSGEQLKLPSAGFTWGHTLSFSSDGKYALGEGREQSGSVLRVWGSQTGREIRTFKSLLGSSYPIAISPNGKYIASGGDVLRIWDTASGRQLRRFTSGKVGFLAFSPDNKHIICAEGWKGSELKIWDTLSGNLTKVVKIPGHLSSITLSSDGKYMLTGHGPTTDASSTSIVRIWELASTKLIREFEQMDTFYPLFAVFSPDGRSFVVSNYGYITLYDVRTGRELKKFGQTSPSSKLQSFDPAYYHPVAFSTDGKYLLSGGNPAMLWDIATGTPITPFKSSSWCVYSVGFSPDSRYVLLAGSSNTGPELFETVSAQKVRTFEKAIYHYSGPWAFSPNGRYAFSRDDIWDVKTGKKKEAVRGSNLVFSPDSRRLFIANYGGISTWDVSHWQETADLYGFKDGEWIAFTPDGYYDTTSEGSSRVCWVFPGLLEAFSFEQFESAFKKPDIIRSRIAGNLDIGKPTPSITRPPQIKWPDHLVLKETAEKSYRLSLETFSSDLVNVLRIFVNGKPTLEVPIASTEKEISLEIPLFPGANRITAIAYDTKGFSSNPKYVDVICNRTDLPKPNLYALGVGVSKYSSLSQEWQLSYAHTDAKAVVEAFKKQEGRLFGQVNTKLLTNEEANVGAISDVLSSLERMSENDIAVIFLAGHGIMGKDGTFYYLTSEGSLEEPEKGGVSWKVLDEHLAKVKGRVIILLDACHSGNISTETVVPNDELAHRFSSEGRSGVMVFAASKGRQSALESPDLGGGFGAFAYAVTQALEAKSKEADLNDNGYVEFMELVEYVTKAVDKETEGEQTPWLSRKELFGDLAIASVAGVGVGKLF